MECAYFRAKDVTGLCNAYLEVLPKDDEDHIVQGGSHAPACLKHNSYKVLVNSEVVTKPKMFKMRCTNLLKSNVPA